MYIVNPSLSYSPRFYQAPVKVSRYWKRNLLRVPSRLRCIIVANKQWLGTSEHHGISAIDLRSDLSVTQSNKTSDEVTFSTGWTAGVYIANCMWKCDVSRCLLFIAGWRPDSVQLIIKSSETTFSVDRFGKTTWLPRQPTGNHGHKLFSNIRDGWAGNQGHKVNPIIGRFSCARRTPTWLISSGSDVHRNIY